MRQKLYLECYSGISGDMLVAALLDLGASQEVLEQALSSLPIQGFQIQISRVLKSGLDACDFNVLLDEKQENHDHDMEYLHGHAHDFAPEAEQIHNHEVAYIHSFDDTQEVAHIHSYDHAHDHVHNHEHSHNHEYSHDNEHTRNHMHDHEHRNLQEILAIIHQAKITDRAKELGQRIFTILAKAEAKAHGVALEEVHFHEVGAVDSIVDIISVAVCLDNLGITQVVVPSLYDGRGFVRCQHGMIPIPVPAVSNIVTAYGLQLHLTDIEGELVTPTGAAIVAAVKTSFELPEKFTIQKIGIGAGKRNYERPSLLRAMLIEDSTEVERPRNIQDSTNLEDVIYKLESNIDDCSGETLGFVMERLLAEGARDVHYMPVFMKKNRPAYQLNVICSKTEIAKLEQIIFEDTTTIGIRKIQMERTILPREIWQVETSFGQVQVKVCDINSRKRFYPEYKSVSEICKRLGLPYQEVYHQIIQECKDCI